MKIMLPGENTVKNASTRFHDKLDWSINRFTKSRTAEQSGLHVRRSLFTF